MPGDTILVTGGNRGIGRSIVRALARSGSTVAFTYRTDRSAARELEDELGRTVRAFPLDLTDPEGPSRVVTSVEEELAAIGGLVNNAGSTTSGLLAMTPDAEWQRVLDTNLGGVFRCCRAVLPLLMHRRRGSIVNIVSLGAIHGVAGQSVYAASKAGAIGLTRSLAREVGKRNVRVNAVAPGFVRTDLTAKLSDEQIAVLRAAECLPDGVRVESVAETVCFLLSDAAASITGQCVIVDAGVSA
ncbi:MAG TPA: SDR family oxidoreductase [Candidatus Polarisedimenticolaceae bacterium]|nr:SDR family oxidoreductase [Candidatus Polarisedimenticolaceae bacterium]